MDQRSRSASLVRCSLGAPPRRSHSLRKGRR